MPPSSVDRKTKCQETNNYLAMRDLCGSRLDGSKIWAGSHIAWIASQWTNGDTALSKQILSCSAETTLQQSITSPTQPPTSKCCVPELSDRDHSIFTFCPSISPQPRTVQAADLCFLGRENFAVLQYGFVIVSQRSRGQPMGTQHFRNKYCRAAQKQPFNSRLLLLRSLQRQSAVSPNSDVPEL